MPTNPNGALGSLDYTKEERRALANKSREGPPNFGSPECQRLIEQIHEYMLSKAFPAPQIKEEPESQSESEIQPQPQAEVTGSIWASHLLAHYTLFFPVPTLACCWLLEGTKDRRYEGYHDAIFHLPFIS